MVKQSESIIDIVEKKREKRGFQLFSTSLQNKKSFNKKRLGKISSVYYFIYTASFIFAIAILYIIFSQIIQEHLQPNALQFMDAADITESNKFITYWTWIPLLLIPAALLFAFLRTGTSSQRQF